MNKEKKLINFIIKSLVIFFLMIITSLILSNYIYNKNEIMISSLGNEMATILEKTYCKIDYKEFHYDGFCIENDDVWAFLSQQYNETEEKICKDYINELNEYKDYLKIAINQCKK